MEQLLLTLSDIQNLAGQLGVIFRSSENSATFDLDRDELPTKEVF